ncbi:ectonucleoside triphosphate diphosphohydrolase 5 isoform X2 [Sceloporus undulatus]|uniref:ectonucleoside triphosphate diphosphohydrolase 5 isoform X2 n=1 Tax=Sceloporus undulatus TaxID=8520 RepID=UPI001C4CBE21|nr:ectonucleoside triphosphate diphosphohydrolase 5 isoform X2 [Sceloporus undulatus]
MALSWITVIAIFALSSMYCIVSHPSSELWFQDLFPLKVCPANASEKTFYGIMFDAGSTGTRIHIYTFIQRSPEKPAELEGEIFESVKPGLSAYAAEPEKVREVFEESPFLVPDDSVSVMDGTYEGILAWITVNFLTGQLYGRNQQTVGILDLGGASTQITFLPQLKETLEQSPMDFFTSFQMFNSTYKLYTHSYLGFGLKAARLATLGALDMEADGRRFRSSCLPKQLEAEWHFGGVKYQYGGNKEGETGFEPCYSEVLKVVQGKLHQPQEIRRSSFYAFSYYYDRAVDIDLIEYEKGGVLQVKDFERKAKEGCDIWIATALPALFCVWISVTLQHIKRRFWIWRKYNFTVGKESEQH